jgi:exodeoxyribonuclease VII large subunit
VEIVYISLLKMRKTVMNWVTLSINGVEVSVAFDENSVHVYNAFPIKDDLKLRGYRWNPADKSWYIAPGDVDVEMETLKNNLETPTPSPVGMKIASTVERDEGTELVKFPDSYTVSDLRNRIDRLIREGIRGNVWVHGVIASEIKNYKWFSYLDLKDDDENRDIFFRVEVKKQNLEKINRKLTVSGIAQSLEKDLPVFCCVEVYLPLRNVVDVRLSLLDILPEYTQSKIRNQREITLEMLAAEGILENQKKMILPAYISRIGLITSSQGTSIQDIKAGLYPYGSKYQFYFVDSRMEGGYAVDSIIRALDYLENNVEIVLDALIIARGGGSEQSLAVFNDIRLCRRVCTARIPILTAIGHEKDVSAIELCSWLTPTPATPSGIGKYLQNRYLSLQDQLFGTITQLIHHFTTLHHREMEKINAFLKNIPSLAASVSRFREERFISMVRGLERSVSFTVRDQERRIKDLSRRTVESCVGLYVKNKKNIAGLTGLVLARGRVQNRREIGQVQKTIGKLDFDKRYRDNLKLREEITRNANTLLSLSLKYIAGARRDIEARTQLARASDPQSILKKGFSLTLDERNRIIKSLSDFEQHESATLKFHDGSTGIVKKQEDV